MIAAGDHDAPKECSVLCDLNYQSKPVHLPRSVYPTMYLHRCDSKYGIYTSQTAAAPSVGAWWSIFRGKSSNYSSCSSYIGVWAVGKVSGSSIMLMNFNSLLNKMLNWNSSYVHISIQYHVWCTLSTLMWINNLTHHIQYQATHLQRVLNTVQTHIGIEGHLIPCSLLSPISSWSKRRLL